MLNLSFYKIKKRENKMLTNPVPSLKSIVIAHLSPDTLESLTESFIMPKLPSLKERINIRVLGTHNPIKIITDYMLHKEIDRRREKQFGYIHSVVSDFGNKSPRTKRLNKPEPERRLDAYCNIRYTRAEYYDYYYFDHKLAEKIWEEAERRIDLGDYNNYCYTKYQFYDYYKNRELAEEKWNQAIKVKLINRFLFDY